MGTTKIEWTATVNPDGSVTPGATWNPVRGCDPVSPGCQLCYAASVAARFSGPGQPYEGTATRKPGQPAKWTGKILLVEDKLTEPLTWKKRQRVFVNSMSDLFHEKVPDEFIDKVFAVMAHCPWHTFQVLTKRPERLAGYFRGLRERRRGFMHGYFGYLHEVIGQTLAHEGKAYAAWDRVAKHHHGDAVPTCIGDATVWPWPLPNVWLGVSVENQAAADERIPLLLKTPARIRFLSCEPLLGPVDLRLDHECGDPPHHRCPPIPDWVIVGGESGAGARPMNADWARSLRDQCRLAGVSFFMKQMNKKDAIPDDLFIREFPNGH